MGLVELCMACIGGLCKSPNDAKGPRHLDIKVPEIMMGILSRKP